MTKNKMTEQQKIFLLMETESDADYLPPEQPETDDDAYVLELLNNDEQQQRWERLQRERGNI